MFYLIDQNIMKYFNQEKVFLNYLFKNTAVNLAILKSHTNSNSLLFKDMQDLPLHNIFLFLRLLSSNYNSISQDNINNMEINLWDSHNMITSTLNKLHNCNHKYSNPQTYLSGRRNNMVLHFIKERNQILVPIQAITSSLTRAIIIIIDTISLFIISNMKYTSNSIKLILPYLIVNSAFQIIITIL